MKTGAIQISSESERPKSARSRRHTLRTATLGVLFTTLSGLALLMAAGASPARGQTPPPPEDVPAVNAYLESIPTSTGSRPTRKTSASVRSLPPDIKSRLRTVPVRDAETLARIATDAGAGAPQRRLRPIREEIDRDPEPLSTALSTARELVIGGSDTRLLGLLIVLIAIAASTVGLMLREARRQLS